MIDKPVTDSLEGRVAHLEACVHDLADAMVKTLNFVVEMDAAGMTDDPDERAEKFSEAYTKLHSIFSTIREIL